MFQMLGKVKEMVVKPSKLSFKAVLMSQLHNMNWQDQCQIQGEDFNLGSEM